MDKKVFDKLKETKYGKVKLSKLASWAIWDSEEIKNLKYNNPKYIEKNIEKLKSNIVFVGLNFSNKISPWQDWQNFHCIKRLHELLSCKELMGAYMTDIIKNHHNSASGNLMKNLKKVEINKNIDFFFKEIEMLKTKNIEIYLFGGAVESLFKKYVKEDERFKAFIQNKTIIKCQRIYHYAMRGRNYVEKVRIQLGLLQKGLNVRKYPALWDGNL